MSLLEEKPSRLCVPMPFSVPPLSDELLHKLKARIRPVVERDNKLMYLQPVDPRFAGFNIIAPAEEAINLEAIATFTTFHPYRASMFFKPSIADVLAQIPVGYTDQIVAFKTTLETANISQWPEVAREALHWGFHMAYATLYQLA